MNLDKLKALIRLANNNPNDNEANLAARRACKILATEQFQLTEKQPVRTAASKEPAWRSNPTGPSSDAFNEFFKSFSGFGGFRPSEAQKRYWTDSAPHQNAPTEDDWDRQTKKPYPESGPGNIHYKSDPPRRNPEEPFDWVTGKKKQRKQEMRKCTKCGLETMTFRYDEVPWVCNPCLWKEI